MYTPSHMALACLDLSLPSLANVSMLVDLTAVFPEIEMTTWDHVGQIKK